MSDQDGVKGLRSSFRRDMTEWQVRAGTPTDNSYKNPGLLKIALSETGQIENSQK